MKVGTTHWYICHDHIVDIFLLDLPTKADIIRGAIIEDPNA
jgi:hypothetical protein